MSKLDHRSFNQPESIYRPAPLWVWNDGMSAKQIQEHLREFKSHGFGGAFVHPRPGLVTEYLSEEWFSLWREALNYAQELGLKLYIYDENSYPSGFAGGHIPSQLPDCLANAVYMRRMDKTIFHSADGSKLADMLKKPGHRIKVYAYLPADINSFNETKLTYDLTYTPLQDWNQYGEDYLFFELGTPETSSWLGGFAYSDLLRPEVTQLFLETTYEAYRKQFGEHFGHAIPAIFTDEPEVSPGNLFGAGTQFLPFSYWFAGQFEQRNGYDLKDHLPCLFIDNLAESSFTQVDPLKVRYDYYCTVYDLWVNNSVRPLSEWCKQNGIAYTGHYLEHNWPYPWGRTSPSVMSLYEFMDWPAIDMLLTSLLKSNGTEPHLMLTIREAHSAANQFNRERVLCEAYGAGGWDSTFDDYKRIGDWLMVHGINFINQHLTFSTIAGARKRDHPQSFDWRQPWWDDYTALNDYHSRLSYVLSQGETHNRILLLNPTTSAYFTLPGSAVQGLNFGKGDAVYGEFLLLSQELSDKQWDFDYGDEYIIAGHGRAEAGKFIIHSRAYDLIVVHESMMHMKSTTVAMLSSYLDSGGQVVSIGKIGNRVDGSLSEWIAKLSSHANWIGLQEMSQLEGFLQANMSQRLIWEKQDRSLKGIAHLRRVHPDGSETYFIVNSQSEPFISELHVKGSHAELWNPWSGKIEKISYNVIGEKLRIKVKLPQSGSLLLRIYGDVNPFGSIEEPAAMDTACELAATGPLHIYTEEANMFVMDYCDLSVGTKTYKDINVIHGGRIVYEHHGFPASPWDNAVQFKRRLLDREAEFTDRDGFTASYHFYCAPGAALNKVQLLVERFASYHIEVNGQRIVMVSSSTHLDPHLGIGEIGFAIHEGDNTIVLHARKFSVFLELEAVYLAGDFSVIKSADSTKSRWVLAAQQQLSLGSWSDQGLPFYYAAVIYSRAFQLNPSCLKVNLRMQEWQGTALSVVVNGKSAGMLGVGTGNELDISSLVHEGGNEVSIRICGSFKNLLGPHHDSEKPRGKAWPSMWKKAPTFGQPSPEQYDLIDYGLIKDFIIACSY